MNFPSLRREEGRSFKTGDLCKKTGIRKEKPRIPRMGTDKRMLSETVK